MPAETPSAIESSSPATETSSPPDLAARYREVRGTTEYLCEPLSPEDCVVQSMPDASPAKWHLAHTTWFFETFVLAAAVPTRTPFHEKFGFLFNSYYNSVGERHPRPKRGLLTRPSTDEVVEYRQAVDAAMHDLFDEGLPDELHAVVEIGLHHEQQHQELIVTDIKHLLSCNPLQPAYANGNGSGKTVPHAWIDQPGGLQTIGYGGTGFHFDNEAPAHTVHLEPFRLGSRLVTNGEYLEFIDDGGYQQPQLWLSDGWDAVQKHRWNAPLYWRFEGGTWTSFTLSGRQPIDSNEPVCHVSFYEADAFARWAEARLPTEAEWETAAAARTIEGNFVEARRYHPQAADAKASSEGNGDSKSHLLQIFGDVWEWTASPYVAYPGYKPPDGALGEYNGKFMCNQMVLRGGSCATPQSHIRPTYRNFFYPQARWQFSGIRLARDV